MMTLYHVFGLNIVSAVPLPAIPIMSPKPDMVPDVTVNYGNTPLALIEPRFKGVRFQARKNEFLLRVDGVARYHVLNGSSITIAPEKGGTEDDIVVFLIGSAMGALLHQRKILTLHAAAISVNGGSVIFTGRSGIGKSTLAAGFHQRGYPFLVDDLCAINFENGCPAVMPGFPRLKLWADCVEKLSIGKEELKSMRPGKGLDKYFLPVEDFKAIMVPVKSIFVLETTNTNKTEIMEMKRGEKVDPIINNTYRLRFLAGLGGEENHFRQCAAVAAKVAVYRVIRPLKGLLPDALMNMVEERFLK